MVDDVSAQPTLRGLRVALLMHGSMLDPENGKTGLPMLRQSDLEIVAVIDRATAGRSVSDVMRSPDIRAVPIVRSIDEALRYRPEVLVIGFAPLGGRLPHDCRADVVGALRAGLSVAGGLHHSLSGDPEFAAAVHPDRWIWDVRREPPGLKPGRGSAATLACRRILFVGTDMAVGKMTASLEMHRLARARGLRSGFVATGQTGIMISGEGVALDAVRVDFAAGAIEAEVLRQGAGCDVLWIEGQGSLLNPASTATLPLMRGSQPTQMILVHRCGVDHLLDLPDRRIPPLAQVVQLNEAVASAAGMFGTPRVAGIALNTWRLDDSAAKAEVSRIRHETALPVTDVLRFGADPLFDAVLQG